MNGARAAMARADHGGAFLAFRATPGLIAPDAAATVTMAALRPTALAALPRPDPASLKAGISLTAS